MERKQLNETQRAALNRPLPAEAVKPHPSKTFLSTIKIPYVTEVLNEVFGVGGWQTFCDPIESLCTEKMMVVKLTFKVPQYDIHYECFGGNDNSDRGDALKGAETDAMTKIASWMGIGADVFKGRHDEARAIADILAATTKEELQSVWNRVKKLNLESVTNACAQRNRELTNKEN